MANGLTGDFDAVLEVSEMTLDRLAATMHQNGFPHPTLPSLPHVAHFRLSGNGEHGSVAAQIGCPHIVLIDGATDRFKIELGFRARYRADPGSKPLADIINGTVRATYRIHDIDSSCAGWRGIADDYIWLRVIRSSVSFEGYAYNESPLFALVATADHADLIARITKHLSALLSRGYVPRPHLIDRQYKHFRSLARGPGPHCLAVPLSFDGGEPAGDLGSIGENFLGHNDFAVAISGDGIERAIASEMRVLSGTQRDFHIHGDAGFGGGLEIDYHVRVDSIDVKWVGPAGFGTPHENVPNGIIVVTAEGQGWASRLYTSGVFNVAGLSRSDIAMSFSVTQYLSLHFEAPSHFSIVALGGPVTHVSYTGPFSSRVVPRASKEISSQVQATVNSRLALSQSALHSYACADKLAAMVAALKSIDMWADAAFDRATYRPEGIVLRGSIKAASRWAPDVRFHKTAAGDGFDAVNSWIPGGRIDRIDWTWRWYSNSVFGATGQPGTATRRHTFELRRPHTSRTKFGHMIGIEEPLPGLDGLGRVCLTIRGAYIDHVTGAWTPVESVTECVIFGIAVNLPVHTSPYLRVCDPLHADDGLAPEVGVVSLAQVTSQQMPNLLVGYVGQNNWDPQTAEIVLAGLEGCQRGRVGLVVLVLFGEGVLESSDAETINYLRRFSKDSIASVLITDDVGQRWAPHLGVENDVPETQWRLLDPSGVVRWARNDEFNAEELARMLEVTLVAGPPPDLLEIRPGPSVGTLWPNLDIKPADGGSRCPPIPLTRPDLRGSRVLFADRGAASTRAIDRLAREPSVDADLVAVVVRDLSPDETRAIAAKFDGKVPVLADPQGAASLRAGVRWTPSIVGLDAAGRVTRVTADTFPDRRLSPDNSAE